MTESQLWVAADNSTINTDYYAPKMLTEDPKHENTHTIRPLIPSNIYSYSLGQKDF